MGQREIEAHKRGKSKLKAGRMLTVKGEHGRQKWLNRVGGGGCGYGNGGKWITLSLGEGVRAPGETVTRGGGEFPRVARKGGGPKANFVLRGENVLKPILPA